MRYVWSRIPLCTGSSRLCIVIFCVNVYSAYIPQKQKSSFDSIIASSREDWDQSDVGSVSTLVRWRLQALSCTLASPDTVEMASPGVALYDGVSRRC